MLGVPELGIFGESCDNHANCLDDYGIHNGDPRADDAKPYACALYSFCPDHCCPMKHISYAKDCFQSRLNPCYAGNAPARRRCTLNREENRDLLALLSNRINVSCECRLAGYEWSSTFGLCVDVNECTRGEHNCSVEAAETCLNLPGGFECACKLGYAYDAKARACVRSAIVERALAEVSGEPNVTKAKSFFASILEGIAGSIGDRPRVRFDLLLATSSAALRSSMMRASRDTYRRR
ncbi:hypothetical protein KM043_004831 [Ampulex compressa]|nr:hypothetical protein KM043_004831 [Ampulex compressa]